MTKKALILGAILLLVVDLIINLVGALPFMMAVYKLPPDNIWATPSMTTATTIRWIVSLLVANFFIVVMFAYFNASSSAKDLSSTKKGLIYGAMLYLIINLTWISASSVIMIRFNIITQISWLGLDVIAYFAKALLLSYFLNASFMKAKKKAP